MKKNEVIEKMIENVSKKMRIELMRYSHEEVRKMLTQSRLELIEAELKWEN